MSSTLPTGSPTPAASEDSTLPQRKSMRLRQIVDVSSLPAQEGDSLVYDGSTGVWTPNNVTPGPGEIAEEMLADGSVTDPKIGNRTVSDTDDPASDTGMLTTLIGYLANRIRNLSGTANWKDDPVLTIDSLVTHAPRHAVGGADPLTPAEIGAADTSHAADHATAGTDPITPASIGAASTTHASTHATAGSDPITPTDIGAATSGHTHATPAIHAATHASGGTDPVTPAAIGAAATSHTHADVVAAGASGFMTGADKTKLNGIATGAVAVTASAPAAETIGATAVTGSVTTAAARPDHVHAMPTAATIVSSINTQGGVDADLWEGLGRVAQNGVYYQSNGLTDLTIGTSDTTVDTNMSLTLSPGGYLAIATIEINTKDYDDTMMFWIEFSSVRTGPISYFRPRSGMADMVVTVQVITWVNSSAGGTVRVRCKRVSAGTGTAPVVLRTGTADVNHTGLLLLHLGTGV